MTLLVTRRTQRRTCLFRPDDELKELYTYLLAVISERHGVRVHGAMLMSTHEHLVVTDTRGCLPRFLAEFHRLVALCVKVLRKWEGEVWDSRKTSVVELRTREAVIEKLAYIAANPVAASLVERAEDWPGVTTLPKDLGRAAWTARRPNVYLDQANPRWPAIATLRLWPLQNWGVTADRMGQAVKAELGRLEGDARIDAAVTGRTVVGVSRLRCISPFKRAKSFELVRNLNPTFAVGRSQRQAFLLAVRVVREFRAAYRDALAAWRGGLRNTVFPYGTWLMRSLHHVVVPS